MVEQGPLSGKLLGEKYLLDNLLGEGGFGAVYRARHLLLNRSQAIKVLLERYVKSPKFRDRFQREAQTLATLDHPNIVHIDDFIIDERKLQAFLVMPFISNGTLRDLLHAKRQSLTYEEITRYLEQICLALDYAHQHQVVHLDLKPQNLLIHADGRILLSDFGLAHLVKEETLEGGSSLFYGTPHYKAPEHWKGVPEKCSDIYAIGVILYEMLTGQRPFKGTTPEAIMMQHMLKQPLPLRSFRPELPGDLEEVLQKALAKDPSQRYQSAGNLLSDFKAAGRRQFPLPEDRFRKAGDNILQQAREQPQRSMDIKGKNWQDGAKFELEEIDSKRGQQLQAFEGYQESRKGMEARQTNRQQETLAEDALTVRFAIGKLNDYLQWFLMVIETMLLIRFVLKLFGADPMNSFATFIFTLTDILLVPFNSIVAPISLHVNQAIEFSTLLAMGIYFLIFWSLRRFLRVLTSDSEEPSK